MNLNKLSVAILVATLQFSNPANALLGPIKIYLNTEYRTETPVIGAIVSSIKLDKKVNTYNTSFKFCFAIINN